MSYYFYDKYEVTDWWNRTSENSLDNILVVGDNVTYINVEGEGLGGYYGGYSDGAYTDFNVEGYEIISAEYGAVTGYLTYRIDPAELQDFPLGVGEDIYAYFNEWYDGDFYFWRYAVAKGYVTYTSGGKVYWHITDILELQEEYDIYYHAEKGELLEEDIAKDDSYPKDGMKDGFWWVRKGLFTIPSPVLISPENAFVFEEGDDVPYFVFELQGRDIIPAISEDNNSYHVRMRMGAKSDFKSGVNIEAESKETQSGWEYYNESNEAWEAFPAGGVSAYTKVRYKPDLSVLDFGFAYWDATAHNPTWNYGANSKARSFIAIINAEGRLYVLHVNGKEYRAINLEVIESSNGEMGSIEFTLSNHRA